MMLCCYLDLECNNITDRPKSLCLSVWKTGCPCKAFIAVITLVPLNTHIEMGRIGYASRRCVGITAHHLKHNIDRSVATLSSWESPRGTFLTKDNLWVTQNINPYLHYIHCHGAVKR